MKLVVSCCFILCYIWLAECEDLKKKNAACYKAKICIHNNKEKCGVNGKGRFRRFIDSCDILEYNCLRETDFVKTTYESCSSLPPMKANASPETNPESDSNAYQPLNEGSGDEPLNGNEKLLTGDDEERKELALSENKNGQDNATTLNGTEKLLLPGNEGDRNAPALSENENGRII